MEGFPDQRSQRELISRELWEYADAISEERVRLEQQRDNLYSEVQQLRTNPNLHEQELIIQKEKLYWEIIAALEALEQKEDTLQNHILSVEEGNYDIEEIKSFLPKEEKQDTPKISRRKQKILEERERERELLLSQMEPEIAEFYRHFNLRPVSHDEHNPNRLTTGRRATKIKGNFDTLDAEGMFYEKTIDTHGGKVRKRKGSNSFVGKGGKRIRKK